MKVLVVDDSKVARTIIRAVILDKHPDWSVTEAPNGAEALALASQEPFDIFSIDINMPGVDGFGLVEQLRAQGARGRMALFSANVQEPVRQRAADLGVAFISKPVTPVSVEALLAAVGHESP
ncbi:response regulator [Azovibrio restrictus]|uniref:response regulator n=1 Tax=Azovibrio restrictus TaxID=146938 RepID=UPI0003FDC885|nr:response regulator [Azovibrio restrictus]MCE1171390.1 response regulator [Azovibrio sp.]